MTQISKLVFILIVTAVFLGGCQNAQQKEEIKIVGADQHKVQLMQRIEKKYEDPAAHYELGKMYQADGLWQKAEFEFNVAMGYDPTHRKAEAALVKTLLDSGSQARATLMAENFMNQASYSASASLLLGRAFQKELLDDYALACYHQALGLAPNSAGLNKQVGYYYLAKGDNVRAEEYLRRSFQLNPNQPEVAGQLGRLGIMVQVPKKKESGLKIDKLFENLFNKEKKEAKKAGL